MNKNSSLPAQSFETSVEKFKSKKRTRNILYGLPTDKRYGNTGINPIKTRDTSHLIIFKKLMYYNQINFL